MRLAMFLALFCLAFISGCGGGGADYVDNPQLEKSSEYVNMPAGFQVIGDHGVVQIDENYTNMGLRHRGQAALTGLSDLVVTDVDTPLLCIKSPNMAVMLVGATRSGSTITYRLASAAGTIDWYVFDKMRAPPAGSSGAGLQVYTSAGVLAFDSTNPPMRIVGITDLPNAQQGVYPPPPGSITAPAGDYAACLSFSRVRATYGNSPDVMLGDGVRTSATGASTEMIVFKQLPPYAIPGDYLQPMGGKLFLVDVTNL